MKKLKRSVEVFKIAIWLCTQTAKKAKNKEIFRRLFAGAWGLERGNAIITDDLTLWEFSTYLYNEGYRLGMRK